MTAKNELTTSGLIAAGGVLDRIVEAKAKRLEDAKRRAPLSQLIEQARETVSLRAKRSFAESLIRPDRINIIAEIKHRSPSKGIIREDFNPVSLVESYACGGAAALSVLAEEDFFGGSLEHLRAVRERVDLPLLRKDFLFDDYQLYETAVAGADAILLIVAMLGDELLARLIALAAELRLDSLVEVHSEEEMSRAARAGARIIGVNNRDLTTFAVDLNTSIRLAPLAPSGATLVSESGITVGADIRLLKEAGFDAFLVGEHFMRAADPGAALARLIEEAESL
ncbi:MAG TPA: indole-3-glycerol phosphate synthase TrpC [Blastocatellia bacterium]|nr:indole-3-glycerol phosphate synthase TrpC [Blastocatellia bacterium]